MLRLGIRAGYIFVSRWGESMTEKKKRQKVVAEITASHLAEFVTRMGRTMTETDALMFLNHEGHAYEMWKHMMLAGEEYIKSALKEQSQLGIASARLSAERRGITIQ